MVEKSYTKLEMQMLDYRRKLEKTLASPELMNDGKLQSLVRNQILHSSSHHDLNFEGEIENVVDKRTKEVSNVLSMLRSTADIHNSKPSKDSHGAWKVKEESDEFRVMYREGAEGTPFHTLLVEGYVDGPLDVCLCISWETGLYNKWWPQTSIPTFKIISSGCLKRVRTGEQISLVRMKVSWPLSSREAVLHYFAFEYLQDDLVVVLFNSISDSESIDRCSHGFTREGIPNAEELVRINVVGGFACQKVTANRCYFRVVASLDLKIDMVPPSFINFISRHLLGSGFKLFKKEVASVSAGDENFREALKDPFYTRIREGLDSKSSSICDLKRSTFIRVEDKSEPIFEDPILSEVDELKGDEETIDHHTLKSSHCGTEKVTISPEVEQALEILEKVNSIVRESASTPPTSRINNIDLTNLDEECVEESITSKGDKKCVELSSENEARVKESNFYKKETNQGKIATNISSMNQKTSKGKSVSRLKNIKSRFCCLRIISS